MEKLSKHWDTLFQNTDEKKLGWYEKDFSQTIKFLNKIPGWQQAKIFVPGVGISGLLDILLDSNANIVCNDISSKAIEKARKTHHLSQNEIQWICQDISNELPLVADSIDIWIDRAVLHFLTEDDDIDGYFKNIKHAVKPGGYAILAEFSKKGATQCAGLDVRRYSIQDLSEKMAVFRLIASEEYLYVNPKEDRKPYIYTLFKKEEA